MLQGAIFLNDRARFDCVGAGDQRRALCAAAGSMASFAATRS
jgi:hypothetical protein